MFSLEDAWYVDLDDGELKAASKVHGEGTQLKPAEAFTVSLKTVFPAKNFEGAFGGGNDIMILTRAALGDQPRVRRVHFYRKGLPDRDPIDDIFSETIFTAEDWRGDRLWLEIIVVEIDKSDNERSTAIDTFGNLAAKFGSVFPAMIPYTFAVKPVLKVVDRLDSALRKNDDVLRVPFSLHQDAGPGVAPLQEGYYVLFANHISNAARYKLDLNNGFIMDGNGHPDISYVVFAVKRGVRNGPKFEASQKVARLLSQMDDGGPSAKDTVDFLIDTLTSYDNFKKLRRFEELSEKDPALLTDEEKALMERIKEIEELKPFVGSGA